jgi:hypothetical protein
MMRVVRKLVSCLRCIVIPAALLIAASGASSCSSEPGTDLPAGAKENVTPNKTTTTATFEIFPVVTDSTTTIVTK